MAHVISITGSELTPILVMIKFLDAFLNFGQGIMTFAIFGLESQYVFAPITRWGQKASSIWKDPETQTDDTRLPIYLKFVRTLAKKKLSIFQNDEMRMSDKKERTPKISDALHNMTPPEHVMLNFCSY